MSSAKPKMRNIIEQATTTKKFSMPTLFKDVIPALSGTRAIELHNSISGILGKQLSNYVFQGLLRNTFLIELVKTPKIETTKFAERWSTRFERHDPRFASYESCFQTFEDLLIELKDIAKEPSVKEILQLFQAQNLLPYEIPVDYKEITTTGSINSTENIIWFWDDLPNKVLKLRSVLLGKKTKKGSDPNTLFLKAAYEKIRVKTYLTDRVLTGLHKTNREKRWETHPASVHFASRRNCLEIEAILINQLCRFEGFPTEIRQRLEDAGILLSLKELRQKEDEEILLPGDSFYCPITMEPLHFRDFEKEVSDPQHGRSVFQVGHMNPLKAINDDPYSGHTAKNISWVSSNGNRIQGHLSLRETRKMIQSIAEKYKQFKILTE